MVLVPRKRGSAKGDFFMKVCVVCAKPLVKRPKETKYDFNKRKCCGVTCSAKKASIEAHKKRGPSARLGIEFFLWSDKAEEMMKLCGVPTQRL